ncbi:MAG: SDR family NAD(P)-dependent oxidoreductase [Halioglobus sp.]
MKNFEHKVAVITGAASGIGLGIARKAAQLGMHLVIADIEEEPLESARVELESLGVGDVLAVQCNVSDAQQMQQLAQRTFAAFETVHLLVNNAGVGGGSNNLWEMDTDYLDWVLGVNLYGVVHGLRNFTQVMIDQGEGHIVNTASVAGLMSAPNTGAYTISKHAVVGLSEMLHGELSKAGGKVGVSVLCPSFVDTRIFASERNRPLDETSKLDPDYVVEQQAMEEMASEFFKSVAISTERVADQVFAAIEAEEFYILTHPQGSKTQVEARMRSILDGGVPTATGPESFPFD